MIQLEHDYQGQDYSVNVKAMNPSPVDATGIYMASYLQSLTKNLAFGVEMLHQRPQPDMSETAASYLAKYTSSDKSWIATAQLQPAGMLQATYWQKLSEKVDVAADLQVIAAAGRRDAVASLGAKYDLRMSTFRAQLDSTGKVSALLEQRFAPSFAFLVSGEIDHFKVGRAARLSSAHIMTDSLFVERGEGRCWCDDREPQHDTGGDEHDADASDGDPAWSTLVRPYTTPLPRDISICLRVTYPSFTSTSTVHALSCSRIMSSLLRDTRHMRAWDTPPG